MAQSLFIEKTFGYLSKIHLSSLRGKSETRKNRAKKSHQPFLPGVPKYVVPHNFLLCSAQQTSGGEWQRSVRLPIRNDHRHQAWIDQLWLPELRKAVLVSECAAPRSCSGVPSKMTLPPLLPPSGPISMIQSAFLMTSRLCSITITVLPVSTSRLMTSIKWL